VVIAVRAPGADASGAVDAASMAITRAGQLVALDEAATGGTETVRSAVLTHGTPHAP
jgi:hypothetical protein